MTPLPAEYTAVSRHLTEKSSIVHEGAAYEIGKFQACNGDFQVIVGEPGMRNASMAVATERAIRYFEPQVAILCGIAGGIKDLEVGDIAIAKSAFDYDSGKESDNGFLPRPVEYKFSDELLAHAQLVQRADNWKSRTLDGAQDAKALIASVAAGDKVISAVNSTTFDRIQQYLSHCKFLEMEAAGFGLAIQRYRDIHAIVVRGISDLCFNKTEADDRDWQPMAADRAAAFAFELLWNFSKSIQPAKEVTEEASPNHDDLPAEIKSKLLEVIQVGRVESVIKQLVQYVNTDYGFLKKDVTVISAQWRDNEKNRMRGVISFENYSLRRNQLLTSLFDILS